MDTVGINGLLDDGPLDDWAMITEHIRVENRGCGAREHVVRVFAGKGLDLVCLRAMVRRSLGPLPLDVDF